MNGTDIYNNFINGSSDTLQAASDAVKQLANGYLTDAYAIRDLQTRMNSAWTGASGDAAYAGANPLAQAFKDSSGPLDITTASMQSQSEVFEQSKSRVVPVPPAPAKPSGWSIGLKAAIPIVGPSMAAGDVASYQEGVAKTNAANENNVRVMDQYSTVTGDTMGKIPMDYKIVPTDNASIGLKPPTIGVVRSEIASAYNETTHASSSTGYQSVGSPVGGGPVSAPPSLNGPSSASASAPPAGGAPGPVSGVPNIPAASSGPGGTGSSAFVPGVAGGSGGSSGDTERPGAGYRAGTSSSGPGGASAGRNSAASRLYGSESEGGGRGAGGGESVGRGGSAAGESARGPGSGKSTGAGNLGSAAAAEEAAAGRSAAKGAGGAPMGGAGQRGRGADDEEHQRPDYLLEADPDSIFGTDVRATPPVLGE
jgi:hypothetical protein